MNDLVALAGLLKQESRSLWCNHPHYTRFQRWRLCLAKRVGEKFLVKS
jgi:hypothetical protein